MYPVVMEKPCFFTIATACIEVYNRETTGFILGNVKSRTIQRKNLQAMVLDAAYPLQTAKRKPSMVEPGNTRALDRVESTIKSMEYQIIGGYHSHPDAPPRLSEGDKAYAQDRMDKLASRKYIGSGKDWLELVVSVRKRHYVTEHMIGWTFHDYKEKARAVFTIDRHMGYLITLGAYWMYNKNSKFRTKEVEVFIPWWNGYWANRSK